MSEQEPKNQKSPSVVGRLTEKIRGKFSGLLSISLQLDSDGIIEELANFRQNPGNPTSRQIIGQILKNFKGNEEELYEIMVQYAKEDYYARKKQNDPDIPTAILVLAGSLKNHPDISCELLKQIYYGFKPLEKQYRSSMPSPSKQMFLRGVLRAINEGYTMPAGTLEFLEYIKSKESKHYKNALKSLKK